MKNILLISILFLISCSEQRENGKYLEMDGFTYEYKDGLLVSKVKYVNGKEEGMKTTFSNSDKHTLYTFWKGGIQGLKVFETDENGILLLDTTTITAYIRPNVFISGSDVEFYVKLNNPLMKIEECFYSYKFKDFDTTQLKDSIPFDSNNIINYKEHYHRIGEHSANLNIILNYKGILKYYTVELVLYSMGEKEYDKYINGTLEYSLSKEPGCTLIKYD